MLGADAWWADASELDVHSNALLEKRIDALSPNAQVYFPGAGDWYDFTTGEVHRDRTTADVSAPA